MGIVSGNNHMKAHQNHGAAISAQIAQKPLNASRFGMY